MLAAKPGGGYFRRSMRAYFFFQGCVLLYIPAAPVLPYIQTGALTVGKFVWAWRNLHQAPSIVIVRLSSILCGVR